MWLTQDYEQLCDHFCEELNLRLKSIQESLLEVDRYRDEIVEQTLGAAKAGIDILNSLTKQSKLPPTLTHFGERSFLKIRLKDPVDLSERKIRIEQLIDDIIDATKVPSGTELVQQAVRRLANPIHIEVLFPDADSVQAAYIPIKDMKKQSGGEYLTSAILIYCTLSRVRAANRGDRLDKTSTLLLDNPFGKASRPKFLELQREVARAMNIQLIFTTGIDDLEALAIFPNIIRLRNERQDPATGEKILEMEPDAGSIEAARLQITVDLDGITPEQEEFLLRVNKGLAQGSFDKLAPLMYRSLELTGHEKRLKALTKTVLFEEGRLSLDLLGCIPRIPPLVTETICDRAIAIVFENVESFQVARNVLTTMPNPPYGIVAYGAGRSFQQSILNFGAMNRSIERIEYVGDLDRAGLSIAMAATKTALEQGFPPVMPARGIHQAMIQASRHFGHSLGLLNEKQDSDKNDEVIITWLPADIRQEVLIILRARRKIPEEILSHDEMQELWERLVE